jgi:hypothetical protein
MLVSEIRLYETLKHNIGEKEAEKFMIAIEEKIDNKLDQAKNELATKKDVMDLRTEVLRQIYITNLGQFLAIVASIISLILALKK